MEPKKTNKSTLQARRSYFDLVDKFNELDTTIDKLDYFTEMIIHYRFVFRLLLDVKPTIAESECKIRHEQADNIAKGLYLHYKKVHDQTGDRVIAKYKKAFMDSLQDDELTPVRTVEEMYDQLSHRLEAFYLDKINKK